MKNLITILGIAFAYIWAWANGWKYCLLAFIILSVIFTSCGDKDGCGSYGKWESKHSFNK